MFGNQKARKVLATVGFFLFLLASAGVMAFFAEQAPDVARIVWRVIIGGGVLLLFMVWDLWSGDEVPSE